MEGYQQLRAALAVPNAQLGAISRPRRKAAIIEAKTWPCGESYQDQLFTIVSMCAGCQVVLGKPGKEAEPGYARHNAHDMTPWVIEGGVRSNSTPSFNDVFREFQHMAASYGEEGRVGEACLELMACLLFRAAYMLDHKDVGDGCWRYAPPEDVLVILDRDMPVVFDLGIPTQAFLHLIDALAWNEDVKYNPEPETGLRPTGRQNTLLTCVNVIGMFLDRVSVVDVLGEMARMRGVAPITQKAALQHFELLRPLN